MAFPTFTFPLQIDFGQTVYWIGDAGPFQYGEAVTAFFAGELTAEGVGDDLLLMRQLEDYLQAFGEHLQPYASETSYDAAARARVILYPYTFAPPPQMQALFGLSLVSLAPIIPYFTCFCLYFNAFGVAK